MERNDDNNDIKRSNIEKPEEENNNIQNKVEEFKEDINSQKLESNKHITNKNEETKDKNKIEKIKNKKIYIGMICFLLLIIIMYFSTKRYDDLVYPDITLYEEDLSRLNENQLDDKVNNLVNDIKTNKIIVKVEDKEYNISISEIIEKLDDKKVKNEIMNYGKDKTFLEQFGLIYLNVERNYKFNIKIDNDVLQLKTKEIYEDSKIDAVEPTLEKNGEKIDIIPGKNGKSIDQGDLVNKIIDAINNNDIVKNNIVLEEEYNLNSPKISEKDLQGVDSKISSATTYFGGTGYNRGLNIANATSKIDKTVLMPGEEFSYEDKVSPVELSNGYYMAPVIVDGTHKDAPGGGVCQVSTTLYNAELKAGILPTERYNHSKPISYVQKGLDATLATGNKNLRFKNPYKYPIYIHAYTIGGQITVEIWSNKSVLDGKKYVPVSFVKGNVANTYLYGYNNKGELIYKKFIDTSIYR